MDVNEFAERFNLLEKQLLSVVLESKQSAMIILSVLSDLIVLITKSEFPNDKDTFDAIVEGIKRVYELEGEDGKE